MVMYHLLNEATETRIEKVVIGKAKVKNCLVLPARYTAGMAKNIIEII